MDHADLAKTSPEQQELPDLRNFDFCNEQKKQNINVTLLNADLWRKFRAVGTEMVVNKQGRRLFPLPEISISGLEPGGLYSVALRLVPLSDKRFVFSQISGWETMGTTPDYLQRTGGNNVPHHKSPTLGRNWQAEHIVFSKLKLTNDLLKQGNPSMMVLRSMNKYKIAIDVTHHIDRITSSQLFFELEDTEFIAVTAYQNTQLTHLKIEHNPFAKAFRETGSWYGKRKRSLLDSDDTGSTTPSEESETCSLSPKEKKAVPGLNLHNPKPCHAAPVTLAGMLWPPQYNWLPYWYHQSMWPLSTTQLLPAHLLSSSSSPLTTSPYVNFTTLPLNSPAELNEPFDFSLPKARS